MSEFQIGLVARLDSSKSKQQLNSDIEALKKQLTTVEVQQEQRKIYFPLLMKESMYHLNLIVINRLTDNINNIGNINSIFCIWL